MNNRKGLVFSYDRSCQIPYLHRLSSPETTIVFETNKNREKHCVQFLGNEGKNDIV